MSVKLTIKQEKFANLYVELGNASEAYRKSYSCVNMKEKTINERASRLLKECKISARVTELQRQAQKRADIKKDDAIKALSDIARANILNFVEIVDNLEIGEADDLYGIGGQTISIKSLAKLSPEQQSCIKSITPVRGGVKLELYDKLQAIDRISKLLGWDAPVKTEEDVNMNIASGSHEVVFKHYKDD